MFLKQVSALGPHLQSSLAICFSFLDDRAHCDHKKTDSTISRPHDSASTRPSADISPQNEIKYGSSLRTRVLLETLSGAFDLYGFQATNQGVLPMYR